MAGGRSHKYGAKRTTCAADHSHPSKGEAKRCDDLHLLERAGEIRGLEVQPQYWFHIDGEVIKHPNGRRVGYKPDWRYFEGNATIAEDFKGYRTEAYVLRIAIFRAIYRGIVHRETRRA